MTKESGLNTVRVTPNFLANEFLPACQGLLVERCGGKFGYALTKNYKSAMILYEEMRQIRIQKMKDFAQLDEKGEMKLTEKVQGQPQEPIWKDDAAQKAYGDWENNWSMKEEFSIDMHLVDEKELETISNCTPALLLVMEPMIRKPAAPMKAVPKTA